VVNGASNDRSVSRPRTSGPERVCSRFGRGLHSTRKDACFFLCRLDYSRARVSMVLVEGLRWSKKRFTREWIRSRQTFARHRPVVAKKKGYPPRGGSFFFLAQLRNSWGRGWVNDTGISVRDSLNLTEVSRKRAAPRHYIDPAFPHCSREGEAGVLRGPIISAKGKASQGGRCPGTGPHDVRGDDDLREASHKDYRVSLRSSSKWVSSNPSPNGVIIGQGFSR
jgi:hypothetical protein